MLKKRGNSSARTYFPQSKETKFESRRHFIHKAEIISLRAKTTSAAASRTIFNATISAGQLHAGPVGLHTSNAGLKVLKLSLY